MQVIELWRHPVKSLQGERLESADVLESGIAFDRAWGIRADDGRILTGRRQPELLLASATLEDEEPVITLPDGSVLHGTGADVDAALTKWLGTPVSLVEAAKEPASIGQFYADPTDDTSEVIEWTMPQGRFVDALPLLVLTTSSLRTAAGLYPAGDWTTRRFRPNIVIDTEDGGWLEDEWLRQTVTVGAAAVRPRARCGRCTMVTRLQPDIERDLDIYKTLLHHHNGDLGVWSTVITPATVHVGDSVTL